MQGISMGCLCYRQQDWLACVGISDGAMITIGNIIKAGRGKAMAFPSNKFLAESTQKSIRTIERHVKEGVDKGILARGTIRTEETKREGFVILPHPELVKWVNKTRAKLKTPVQVVVQNLNGIFFASRVSQSASFLSPEATEMAQPSNYKEEREKSEVSTLPPPPQSAAAAAGAAGERGGGQVLKNSGVANGRGTESLSLGGKSVPSSVLGSAAGIENDLHGSGRVDPDDRTLARSQTTRGKTLHLSEYRQNVPEGFGINGIHQYQNPDGLFSNNLPAEGDSGNIYGYCGVNSGRTISAPNTGTDMGTEDKICGEIRGGDRITIEYLGGKGIDTVDLERRSGGCYPSDSISGIGISYRSEPIQHERHDKIHFEHEVRTGDQRTETVAPAWQAALALLVQRLPETEVNLWLRPIRAMENGAGLRLDCPDRYAQAHIEAHFGQAIGEALRQVGVEHFIFSFGVVQMELQRQEERQERDRAAAETARRYRELASQPLWEQFLVLWSYHPRKTCGKWLAWRLFQRLYKRGELPEIGVLLDTVRKQKASEDWKKRDGQWIPGLYGWLQQRPWWNLGNEKQEAQSWLCPS